MNNGELKCQLAVFIFQKNSLKVDCGKYQMAV